MHIDPALLSPVSALMGALIGGSTTLVAAVYTQRHQDRLQRVASETAKRETVYADFVLSASNLLLNAYTRGTPFAVRYGARWAESRRQQVG
jgi:hypothetical protein